MELLEATYRITGGSSEPKDRIESILLEQTIETPRSVAERYPFVREQMMGSVREIVPDDRGGYLATLSLPSNTASIDPAQFLNVLFGNSSLHDDVQLEDFTLPQSMDRLFGGPQYGVQGLRDIVAVRDRPLTCGALKPVGLRLPELAELCRGLTSGGIDMIKDDHYLAEQPFAPFEERVRTCLDAVADAAAASGSITIYIPNLSGTPDSIRRQADFAQRAGARALMIAPMLAGLPLLYELTTRYLEVPVLAHPSFGGAIRIRPRTLFGKLFRLFGADAVIFANYGGRFSYPRDVCRDIADSLREDWMSMKPSFPVPAGGMDAERASELVQFFGLDTILLIGGSLLEAGDDLANKTAAFTQRVATSAITLMNAS